MTNKNKVLDFKKVQDDLVSSTRNVWLAGLGVLATVEEEGQNLFGELVERGKKAEARGKKTWKKARLDLETTSGEISDEISGRIDQVSGKLDLRVSEVLQRMGVPSSSQIEELTERVQDLSNQVDRLTTASTKPAAKKPAAKKPAAKKSTAKTKAA
jgi:poly(hydroxyalkanoate) granule-associated protein